MIHAQTNGIGLDDKYTMVTCRIPKLDQLFVNGFDFF
jgi:hypothetical protein